MRDTAQTWALMCSKVTTMMEPKKKNKTMQAALKSIHAHECEFTRTKNAGSATFLTYQKVGVTMGMWKA